MDVQIEFQFKSDNFYKFQCICRKLLNYARQIYVMFWHRLSQDERVKSSPDDPSPENEVKMTTNAIVYVRSHRIVFLVSHIFAIITFYNCLRGRVMIQTIIFMFFLMILSQLGIVCGTHRLWSHNSFKAAGPLRVFLMLCQTMTSQYSILYWTRAHRVHHKFSDTSKDPHNANKGFFFSHMGWLLTQRSPEVKEAMKNIYIEDLKNDKVVMFQNKYYVFMVIPLCWIIPGLIPWYFWNENFFLAYGVAVFLRFVIVLNSTCTVNSIAHMWGMKPFDRFIRPSDIPLVWLSTMGDEGWHNYHHAFPWDYRSSDLWGYRCGITTIFIEFCAKFGWIYDLKTTSVEVALKRRQRTGDLTCNVWGWNDSSLDPIDKRLARIYLQENSGNCDQSKKQ